MTKLNRYGIVVWFGIGVGAVGLGAAAANAGLPPLPAAWPVASTMAEAREAPLPPGVPDGAIDDAIDGAADRAASHAQSDRTHEAASPGASPPPFEHASRVAQHAQPAAPAPALEGPPIPLPPPARMNDAAARRAGDADDTRRISLNLQRADLTAAFDAFARFTGLNIVVSEQVRGTVTLRLNNVRWRDAFDTLLDTHGLAMSRRGDIVWVTPAAELAVRERERFETHARAADLEPLESRRFELHYARAQDVQRLLAGATGQRLLSKRGAAAADARTNLLFVTDLAPRIAQIADLIAALDRPSRQVRIEARIVEGEQGFSRHLGARLALRAQERPAAAEAAASAAGPRTALDLAARPLAGFDAATAGFTLLAAPLSRVLDVELSALEAQGRGQIVSSPRVVTADRAKALVEQGAELPYQAKVGNGVTGVQFRRATLKLEVEPQITPDGRVVLDLDVTKDSVGEPTAAGPAIHTKHVQTRVEVDDGGTVAIGGIYERLHRHDVTRVPLLGKIPVLGALFRHRAQREQRSELVVFITPTIVSAGCGPPGTADENAEKSGPEAGGAGSTRQSLCQ